ncbi:hypothetical protein WICPIJ_000378 [Wickerhamomyces pijperi]|uniref:Uncharacterized protein n=1 Tax=Wickerhamomyces pijperi TaxID=599730 RepID=A0A9P8QCX8_WICPI|nr:hypothetical protein WICPIJ_000378 [Wickerhamomyces pijperi]
MSPLMSNLSQILSNSLSLYLPFGEAIGSEKPKNGKAKFTKPFFCGSDGWDNSTSNELGLLTISNFDLVVQSSGVRGRGNELNVMVGVIVLFKLNWGQSINGSGARLAPDQNGAPVEVTASFGKLNNNWLMSWLNFFSNSNLAHLTQSSNEYGLSFKESAMD